MSVALLEAGPEVTACFSDRKIQRGLCLEEVRRMGAVAFQGEVFTRDDFFLHLDTATQSALAGLFCYIEQNGPGQVESQGVLSSHIASEGFPLMTATFTTADGVRVFLAKHQIPDSIGIRSIYNGGFGRYGKYLKADPTKESVKFLTFLPDKYCYGSLDDLQAHYLHGSRMVKELAAAIDARYLGNLLDYTIIENNDD